MLLDTNYPRLLEIADGHTLRQERESLDTREHSTCETRWFSERNEQQQLIARYRTWFNRGLNAPWRQQLGWERYTPDGELQVREVRYARGDEPAASGSQFIN